MTLSCWLLVWQRHRESWFGVELGGSEAASTGDWMVGHQICRVNRQISYKKMFRQIWFVPLFVPSLQIYREYYFS